MLLSKGLQCDGDLIDWDLHYNIALVRIKSETRLKAAHLKALDDSMSLDLNALPCSFEETLKARISKEVFNIYPGDKVIAVGRYFKNCYEIMAAPGVFRLVQIMHLCIFYHKKYLQIKLSIMVSLSVITQHCSFTFAQKMNFVVICTRQHS